MSRLLLKALQIHKKLLNTTSPIKRGNYQDILESVLDALEPDDFDKFYEIINQTA